MSGKESLAVMLRRAASLAGNAISKAVDSVVTPPPSSPQARTTTPPPMPPARSEFDYGMPLEEFLGNLSGRRDESGKLVDAKSYIKAHRNDDDFSFENVKMISTALQHDDTPYSKEEALLLGIEAVGKNKALQQKLAEGYTGQLRGAEEIGAVAGLLLSEQVLPQGKKIIADYLQKNRSEDTVEYFATLLPVRQTEAIQAIAELNTGLRDAMIIRQAGAGVAETSSLPTEEEARLFQRAVRYEDGNPAAAKDFLATKTTQQKFKEGIVQIIQERRFQEKEVTYADIATMVSNAPLPVQTIETFGRGIAPSKLKVEDVIPFALRTFAGEETRAVGGAGAAEDNPGLFIKGLDLSQDQVLSLGGDPSMPKEYLGKIIAQDPDNMAANALEIGKARTDLSFKDVKDLVPEGTPSKKEDAEIFRELAIARAENPESAKKLVEDLTLDQVAQYSKDGGLDLRATGMMMREVNDVMPEALETCYIEALATANIGEIPAQSERFEVFKQNAANIAGSSLDSPQKFSLGAKAILHGKEDKAEIIQQICEGASLSQDEKLELLSAGEVHNFKKAWEITSVASDQKSEFFLKFAKKFGDKAELGEMGVSDFEGVDIKGFALNGSLPERMSKDIAGIILANAEAKRGLTQGERVKLERLNKGADLTPKEYFNHALDHAIIRNKGKEVEDLLDKLDRQDRSAKLKFIDDLNAKHPELKIQVKKSLGERFSLGLRRIWPFGKVPLEKQQEEMAQKVDLSDGLGKVNEVLFKRRERVVEASSRAPKVQLQSRDIPILIDEVAQFEANKRIRGTAESVSQYYGTEDREQAMREDKVRALVNGDKILERISEIPADCTNPDVIKQLVNNAFVVQLIKGKGQEEAVPLAKSMFSDTYQKLCSSIEVAWVESADFRAVAQELERNKQLLLEKAPELTRMFEDQEAGRAFDAGAHKDFFELIKEYETIFKKSKADIETRDRVDDEGLIAGYEGSDRRVKDYQSKIQAIGKCDLAISMLTREEADVVERVSVSLQSTEETKALYGELKDSAFLYQGRSPETKQKPRFASLAAKDQRYNADVKRYNEAKTRICDLFGVEPKHENLQAIIKIANAKESSVVVEDEIGAIKAQLIEKKLRIAPTTEERKAVLRIVQAEVPIIAEAGTPIPPPRTVSSRDSIIGSVKARPRSESNGSTSPLATPFTLSGNPGGLMAGKK